MTLLVQLSLHGPSPAGLLLLVWSTHLQRLDPLTALTSLSIKGC